MKSIKKLFVMPMLAICSLVLISGCYPTVLATEQQQAVFQLTDRLDLRVDNNDGDVIIRTEPGLREIQITATLSAWGTSERDAKEHLSNIKLEMVQTGNQVVLHHVDWHGISFGVYRGDVVKFDILMPEETDLVINIDDGDVIAGNINGNITIDSDDGKMDLSHVTGQLNLESDDGNITITDATGQLDLKTDDGNITVSDAMGSLHALADDGDIWFVGTLVGAQHYARTDDGDITMIIPAESALHIDVTVDDGHIHSTLPIQGTRDDSHWSVTLNAPDAVLTLRSDDGSISIRGKNSLLLSN